MVLPSPCLLAQGMSCGYARRLWAPAVRSPASPMSPPASLTIFSLADLYIRVQSFFLAEVVHVPACCPVCLLVSLNLAASSFSLLIFTCFLYMHQKYSHQCFVLVLNRAASFRISWHKQVRNLPRLHQLSSRPRGWRQSNAQHQNKILGFERFGIFLPSFKS